MTTSPTPTETSPRMHALLERLRRDSDRVFGSRRIHVVPLTFQVREWSEVARVRVDTPVGARHVFAKVLKPKKPGEEGIRDTRERLRHDFEVTSQVFEATKAQAELRAVEPMVWYEDLLGVVTREVAGQPLDLLISKNAAWPASPERLEEVTLAISRVGRWIAKFQEIVSAGPPAPLSLDVMREYIDVRLKRLTGLPRASFDESDRRAILSYFDRRAGEVPSGDLTEVAVHGDVTPSNVMVAPDHITLLDFGMTALGCRYLDIARLYTQLEFYTAKPLYRRQVITGLQQVALTAFDPALRPGTALFELCAVQHVVCHLLSHARQPGPFPVSVYSQHQCRRHRQWLRRRARGTAERSRPLLRFGSLQ